MFHPARCVTWRTAGTLRPSTRIHSTDEYWLSSTPKYNCSKRPWLQTNRLETTDKKKNTQTKLEIRPFQIFFFFIFQTRLFIFSPELKTETRHYQDNRILVLNSRNDLPLVAYHFGAISVRPTFVNLRDGNNNCYYDVLSVHTVKTCCPNIVDVRLIPLWAKDICLKLN